MLWPGGLNVPHVARRRPRLDLGRRGRRRLPPDGLQHPQRPAQGAAARRGPGSRPRSPARATGRTARRARCASRRSHCLGYCVPAPTAFGNPVMDRFLHAISEAAERRGYHVLLFTQAADGSRSALGLRGAARPTGHRRLRPRPTRPSVTPPAVAAPASASRSPPSAGASPMARSARGSTSTAPPARPPPSATSPRSGTGASPSSGWPEGSGVGDDRYRGCVEAAAGSEAGRSSPSNATTNGIERGREVATRLLAWPGRADGTRLRQRRARPRMRCRRPSDRPGARSRRRHHRLRRLTRRRPRRRVADERPPAPRRRPASTSCACSSTSSPTDAAEDEQILLAARRS